MSRPRTDVRAFDTQDSRSHFVRVTTDEDLSVKFSRGDVVRGDRGSIEVAMVLGIDEAECDRIDVSGSGLTMRELLECIKSAVDLALEGCPQ